MICHQKLVTLHAKRDNYPNWTVLPLIDGKNTCTARGISIPYGWRNTDTTVQDSLKEDMDMQADSAATKVPMMVALPLKDIHINSPFGMRRDPMNRRKGRMHYGLDLRAKYEDVYSMLPGTVTAAGTSTAGGNYITIDYGICTCSFLHLSKINVVNGQHVSAGQKIAISGNTGKRTTGPHLHLSCKWSDTGKYFDPRILLKLITEQLMKLKIQ